MLKVLFFICILLSGNAFAQTGQTHRVKKGETLYSIAKFYDTTVDEITRANPLVSKGLKTGMELEIPPKEINKSAGNDTGEKKIILHRIEKGETLYSISKKYEISIQTLLIENPDIIDGLVAGEVLKIPNFSHVGSENSGSGAVSPLESDTLPIQTNISKNSISAAILLPLFLEENFSETDSAENIPWSANPQSIHALEFYEGILMATDSLKKAGISIQLSVFDTRNDSLRIKSALSKIKSSGADIIFGPLQGSELPRIIKFSEENNISMVVPFSVSQSVVSSAPFLISSAPSVKTQCSEMALFLNKEFKNERMFLLSTGSAKEAEIISNFKSALSLKHPVREMIFPKQGIKEIKENLSPKGKNVFVVCSSDESAVNNLLTSLNYLKDSNIVVIGLPTWENFSSLEYSVLQNLHVHYFTTNFVDFENPGTQYFSRKFRKRFMTEPGLFSCQGYDVSLYFLQMFSWYGKRYKEYLSNQRKEAIHTRFEFRQSGENGGYENIHIHVLRHEGFNLKLCR